MDQENLTTLDQIVGHGGHSDFAVGHPFVVFMDFDGTLVDLAPEPDAIDVTGVAGFVSSLSDVLCDRLVIVTGRSVSDLRRHLPECDVPIYGSHGAEIWTGGKVMARTQVPETMTDIRRTSQDFAQEHPDVLFEDKPMGFALHYRQAPELEEPVHQMLNELTEDDDAVTLQDAKMAYEVKPAGIDKGAAVYDAIARFDWGHATPVMIGDDVTDEAGMAAAIELGGFGIKVGEGETVARYRTDTPASLRKSLTRLLGVMA